MVGKLSAIVRGDGVTLLLSLLIRNFAPAGALVFAVDDTIERRRGAQITAKGIYRDPVRSSHSHLVKASGLRWLSLMLTVRIPWAERVWALPFLTCLCPSERSYEDWTNLKKVQFLSRSLGGPAKCFAPK